MCDLSTMFADGPLKLPSYDDFAQALADLSLPISCAELHGVLCGYLAADSQHAGELYIRALLAQRKAADTQPASALFEVYSISHRQLSQLGFDFELLLPDDERDLSFRAQAFSEWCEGFTQGLTVSGVPKNRVPNEEVQEAIDHITEFAQLDYAAVQINEADERALLEVIEYTRMAVLSIHAEMQALHPHGSNTQH